MAQEDDDNDDDPMPLSGASEDPASYHDMTGDTHA